MRRPAGLLLSAAAHAALAGAVLASYGTTPLAMAPSASAVDLVAVAPPTPVTPISGSRQAAAPAPVTPRAGTVLAAAIIEPAAEQATAVPAPRRRMPRDTALQPPLRPAHPRQFALAPPRQISLPAPRPAPAPQARPSPAVAAPAAANASTSTSAAPASAAADRAAAVAAPPAAWLRAIATWLAAHREYPARARRAGEQGTVLLRLVIARDGMVRQVSLLAGSGHADLDRASLDILRGARLPPSPSPDGPAQLTLRVPIRYALETSR